MKICIISFYYPPDLCAGSFRAESLVNALLKFNNEITEIEILTTTPNRYNSYKITTKFQNYKSKKIIINRIKVPSHNSRIFGQAIAFLFFSFGVLLKSKNKKWDIIVSTSSRLMTAYLSALIAKYKKIPLYLDIRDLFIDTIKNIFSSSKSKFFLFFLTLIEKWTFNSATKLNLVSRGFEEYVYSIVNNKNLSFYTNGIDDVFFFFFQTKIKIAYPQ